MDSFKELEDYHQMMEKLAKLVPGVIYQYRLYPDGHSSFPYSSPGMIDIYGVRPEEVTIDASKVFTRIHHDDIDKVAREIQLSAENLTTFYSGEFRVNLPGKGPGWRWSQAHPEKLEDGSILWHGIILDITERKEAEAVRKKYEEQLNNSQKLESLGVLAGGIAHDFNNLIGGVFGFLEIARSKTKDEQIRNYLSQALSTIDRAHALTHQLLTFAKGGAPDQKVDYLFPFIQDTVKFALSGSNVSCRYSIQPDLGLCYYDKNQIGQVIDNLFINAKQAMPGGGIIELHADNEYLGKNHKPHLEEGQYVHLTIQDHGAGISPENIEHIFDPFFSTKSTGHGLGLATCYSIISKHKGLIEVESEIGEGSTFHIYLPVTDKPRQEEERELDDTHQGSGTVLLMDDEPAIREIMKGILESFGYGVIMRKEGREAVEYFKAHNNKELGLKAVFLDLTVPGGMSGREAVEKIREINKEIPVFVVSGYSDDPIINNPREFGFTDSMSKPFKITEIAAMLNRYL
ncbi:MAG: response regulator [Spirochaetales bacterium]|nr:response regulator [Spirochaetales bacterium]